MATKRRNIRSVMSEMSDPKNKLKKIWKNFGKTWYLDDWFSKILFLLGGITFIYLVIKLIAFLFKP